MAGGNFSFKQFDIHQEHCAMKVGTDGVLLGAWAHGGQHILDIGTGTGLIAIMMAQRFRGATVKAVEIDDEAARQAMKNVLMLRFANNISVHNCGIQQFNATETFDSIVSNPPYFVDALRNPDPQRSAARHACTLTYGELFAAVKKLLASNGEFSAVIPTDCLAKFTSEAYLAGLAQSRLCYIRTTPRKQPKRALVAFKHATMSQGLEKTEECLQNADGTRSQWYDTLTKEFYIR